MSPAPFRRDRATVLLYVLLAYYAYLQSSVAPAMNFISRELDMSDTLRALHLSGFAVGMIGAGLFSDRIAARFGRPRTVWVGCAGIGGGALLLTLGETPLVTLAAALVMGFVGSCALIMQQALLTDRHPSQRAIPLTEANVLAIILAAAAPLLVSAASETVGWRVPIIAGSLALIILWLAGKDWISDVRPLPHANQRTTTTLALPPRFWLFWGIAFFGVAVEWSMIFWSAAYLERVGGLSTSAATGWASFFLLGMVIGRGVGSRLARITEPPRLLVVNLALAIFGFSTFWLAPNSEIRLLGLTLCGIGIGNVWPLTLPTATAQVPHATDVANARMSLSASLATFLVPQFLGSLADSIGIQSAILVAGVMILFALVAALAGLMSAETQA